jgi:hypothetical protein
LGWQAGANIGLFLGDEDFNYNCGQFSMVARRMMLGVIFSLNFFNN